MVASKHRLEKNRTRKTLAGGGLLITAAGVHGF